LLRTFGRGGDRISCASGSPGGRRICRHRGGEGLASAPSHFMAIEAEGVYLDDHGFR
jgi:hypothetical protein